MADKSAQLILEALGRGVAEPAGLHLYGTRSAPGFFSGNATAKVAAQRSLDDGLLRIVRTETKGKVSSAVCAVTEKGLSYLMSQVSPKQVLEDLVRSLDARQGQVSDLVATAKTTQAALDALKAVVERVLPEVQRQRDQPVTSQPVAPRTASAAIAWTSGVLEDLSGWTIAKPTEDCPLPDLYRKAQNNAPGLTIGHFHDGLRLLHDQEKIYLHPWTGPLYQIPEPPYALLIGHEIAYYASRRCA